MMTNCACTKTTIIIQIAFRQKCLVLNVALRKSCYSCFKMEKKGHTPKLALTEFIFFWSQQQGLETFWPTGLHQSVCAHPHPDKKKNTYLQKKKKNLMKTISLTSSSFLFSLQLGPGRCWTKSWWSSPPPLPSLLKCFLQHLKKTKVEP